MAPIRTTTPDTQLVQVSAAFDFVSPPVHLPVVPSCFSLETHQLLTHFLLHPTLTPKTIFPFTLPPSFLLSTPTISPSSLLCIILALHLSSHPSPHSASTFLSYAQAHYTHALTSVSRAIANPSTRFTDATLAMCLTLITYESLRCPGQSLVGWRWHRDGAVELIKKREEARANGGREVTGDEEWGEVENVLWTEGRKWGLLKALEERRPNFLTLPTPQHTQNAAQHQLHPLTPSPSSFFNIISPIPTILLKAETFATRLKSMETGLRSWNTPRLERDLKDLCRECWNIDLALLFFEQEVERAFHGRRMYWVAGSTQSTAGTGSEEVDDLHLAFEFEDMHAARLLIPLWAYQAMVWNGLEVIRETMRAVGVVDGRERLVRPPRDRQDGGEDGNDGGPDGAEPEISSLTPIRKICRSIRYCTAPETAGSTGPMLVAGPMNIILDVMEGKKGCEKEREMVLKERKTIGERWLRILHYK